MNEKTLVFIELTGRTMVSTASIFIVYSLTNIWITLAIVIIMILWLLNPIFEYKTYGG